MKKPITQEQAIILVREVLAALEAEKVNEAKKMLRETLEWLTKYES